MSSCVLDPLVVVTEAPFKSVCWMDEPYAMHSFIVNGVLDPWLVVVTEASFRSVCWMDEPYAMHSFIVNCILDSLVVVVSTSVCWTSLAALVL